MGDVSYLYEPEGSELHWDGLKQKEKPSIQNASLSGPSPAYSSPVARSGLAGTSPSPQSFKPAPAKLSPEDLLAQANAMLDRQEVQHSYAMHEGPASGSRDDAGSKVPEWLRKEMENDSSL